MNTRHTLRRGLAVTGLAAASLAGVLVVGEGSAAAANSGTVMCVDQSDVVGVWVNVSGGRSGWAGRSGSGYNQHWSYDTQGRNYSLTVGCGGTPQRWATSSSTTYYSRSWADVMCYPGWKYGGASGAVHDRCFAG